MIEKCTNKKVTFTNKFKLSITSDKKDIRVCNLPTKGYSINKGEVKIRYSHIECKTKRRLIRKKRVIVKITNTENDESILRRLKFSANLKDDTLLTDWEGKITLYGDNYKKCYKNELINLKISNANFFERNWLFYWRHPDNLHAYTFKITLVAFILGFVSVILGILSCIGC